MVLSQGIKLLHYKSINESWYMLALQYCWFSLIFDKQTR